MFLQLTRTTQYAVFLCVAIVLSGGCRHRQTTNCPSPAESGLNTRDLIDPIAQPDLEQLIGVDRFTNASEKLGERIRAELLKDAPPGRPERNVLCLSGGGSYGAFSAGVLVGWTARGNRPCFDVVTGISTGALIAPFAFVGPQYDAALEKFYTTITNDQVYTKRVVRGALGAESFTDTAPLRRLISDTITCEMINDVAAAHRAGRRLVIGTTEESGKRPIFWDVGAIASRNGPGDRELIVEVLLGSASIPGAFPSSKIDVCVNGECMTERHVDGGVSQALFFYPPYVPIEQRTPQTLNLVGTNVYVILAGKLYADAEVIKPTAFSQAGTAITGLLYAQTRGDIQRLWTYSLVKGMTFQFTAIPPEFANLGSSGEFDPIVMRGLFDEGLRVICSPKPWRTTAPVTDVSQGEVPLLRQGRNLVFEPRGPQLPISGPRGQKVPPRYPENCLGNPVPVPFQQ